MACLDCSFKITDSLSSVALSSLHRRDHSIGMHLASVHSVVMRADCCIAMHRTRCMRADRCVCIPLDRCASCSMRSFVVMHRTRCSATREIVHDTCMQLGAMQQCNRCAVMHLNRCAVMRVKLWERFGIVRQTRGVDILSGHVVGVCRDRESFQNHYAGCAQYFDGMRVVV